MQLFLDTVIACVYWTSSLAVPLICINCTKLCINTISTSTSTSTSNHVGLALGVGSILCGQMATIVYDWVVYPSRLRRLEATLRHFFQVEGTILLSLYLWSTWHYRLLPESYYSCTTHLQSLPGVYVEISIVDVFLQLLVQDFYQYIAHRLEHMIPYVYRKTHHIHHLHIRPSLFDAFHGTCFDTIVMILIPLYCTAHTVHTDVFSYMTFGTIYANWLVLIHAEYDHMWDPLCRLIGFGTPRDHRIHHKQFKQNFGHIFMYWDWIFGTGEKLTN